MAQEEMPQKMVPDEMQTLVKQNLEQLGYIKPNVELEDPSDKNK